MYAAIRRYRINSECSGKVIRQIAEDFVPLIREAQGLLAYYVLDAENGAFATITICENQAEVEESNRKATEWIKQYLASAILSQEEVSSFFIEVEETLQGTLYGGAPESPHGQDLLQRVKELPRKEASRSSDSQDSNLLSLLEVCRELGMGKSWVYRRIQSGEIPSVKLGRNIKVRREDLEGYLEDQRYQPASGLVG